MKMSPSSPFSAFFSSYGDNFFCKQSNGSLSLCCLTMSVKAFIANTRGLIILVILQGSSLQIFTWSFQSAACTSTPREGMALLEYQAMPFLRGIAHDGVLCTFSTFRQGEVAWSVRQAAWTKSHPAGSPSSSQPGGPPCWASPLAFGLTARTYLLPCHDTGGHALTAF